MLLEETPGPDQEGLPPGVVKIREMVLPQLNKKIEKLIMDTALESASLNDRAKEIAVKLASGEPLEKLDMYILRKSITEMESAKWLLDGGRKTFKEGMEYRPWELDEFGVTNIFNKDSGKLWVVVVDMHS